MDFHKQRRAASERMPQAAAAGQPCISCHKGIAHHLPDMSQDFETTFDDLQSGSHEHQRQGGRCALRADHQTAVRRAARQRGQGTGSAGSSAATPVKVLKTDGDWLEVEIDGWRRRGDKSDWFTRCKVGDFCGGSRTAGGGQSTDRRGDDRQGHRSDLVPGDAHCLDRERRLGSRSQENSGHTGARVPGAACGACHSLQRQGAVLGERVDWRRRRNARRRISLDDEQVRFLEKYLQMHAQDKASNGF